MEDVIFNAQSRIRGRLVLAALSCLVGLFATAPAALAVHSDQYDAFHNPTSCPTASPYLNNPAFPEVVCLVNSANHVAMKLGKFETERDSTTTTSFALVAGDPAINTSCPDGQCLDAVPGSTVLDEAPFKIDLGLPGGGRSHHTSIPPNHGHGSAGHGPLGLLHLRKKLIYGPSAPSLEATMETAGELSQFRVFPGPGQPIFVLPVKFHIEGPLLGDDCYIGSDANPIELRPQTISEPELAGIEDPNGFPLVFIKVTGLALASTDFAVPGAQGCGPAVGLGKHAIHPVDHVIDAALGLPSPAGENALVLTGASTSLLLSPAGGGLMQAAFDAADAP
jgi:hypothetical protein